MRDKELRERVNHLEARMLIAHRRNLLPIEEIVTLLLDKFRLEIHDNKPIFRYTLETRED